MRIIRNTWVEDVDALGRTSVVQQRTRMASIITHDAISIRLGGHIFEGFLDQHGGARQTIALAVTGCDGRGLRMKGRNRNTRRSVCRYGRC